MEQNIIIVDGKEITLEEFQEMQKNPNIKLILVEGVNSSNQYKTLQRLEG